MATEETQLEPEPVMQESIGGPHDPQHSIHGQLASGGAATVFALRERRYDKLRKMGAEDFRGTTNPLEAERWLQRT